MCGKGMKTHALAWSSENSIPLLLIPFLHIKVRLPGLTANERQTRRCFSTGRGFYLKQRGKIVFELAYLAKLLFKN